MGDKTYYCESCGGIMEFNPKSQTLKCPNCGEDKDIHDEKNVKEHRIEEYVPEQVDAEEKETSTMECHSCGASLEMEPNTTSLSCPYCGSHIVMAEKQKAAIVPDGVRPFQIDKDQVRGCFRDWLKKRWLAPGELKHLYQQGKIQGIYIPYWTFDAQVDCPYDAQGGRDRQVEYEDNEGKTQYRIETDWYSTRGRINNFFDDILIRASRTLKENLLRAIGNFRTGDLKSYAPEYFSGYASENYSVPFEEAYRESREEIHSMLVSMAERDVLRTYDRVRAVRVYPEYSNETYKHVLLPVYSTAYMFKGKTYNVLINGENGHVAGDYPKSIFKIVAIVLFVIAVVVAWVYFTG